MTIRRLQIRDAWFIGVLEGAYESASLDGPLGLEIGQDSFSLAF